MNDPNQEDPNREGESSSESAPDTAGASPSCGGSVTEIQERAREAFRSGAADARKAFEEGLPSAEDFARGLRDASYAIGYAVSFGSTLIRELTPYNVSAGFEDGS